MITEISKNIVCLYHGNCSDGHASAAIVKMYYSQPQYEQYNFFLIPGEYSNNDILEQVMAHTPTELIIVDFSFKEHEMDDLVQFHNTSVMNVTWIDHHLSASKYPAWNSLLKGIRSLEKSGCELTWQYFYPQQEPPEIIKLIGDHDTWKFQYGDRTRYLSAAFQENPPHPIHDYDFWKSTLSNESIESYIEQGKSIKSLIDIQVKKSYNTGINMLWHGYKTRCMNSGVNISDTGNYAVQNGYDIGMVWSVRGDRVVVSLRSQLDTDVSELAKKYNGGGHKNAAAFNMSISEFFKEIYNGTK